MKLHQCIALFSWTILSTSPVLAQTSAVPSTECVNDLVFRVDGKRQKDCFWLMKPAKVGRREKLCKRKDVRDACPTACGLCCVAECVNDLDFRVGGKCKKDCDWVMKPAKVKRREKLCQWKGVRAACPDACGLCCLD